MRKLALWLCLLTLAAGSASAGEAVAPDPWLDAAFSLLEEGNPFLERYRALSGSETEALFPLGMPYFYGGVSDTPVFAKYPEYTVRRAWQNAGWFVKGTEYVCGFDCAGYTQWVCKTVTGSPHGKLSSLMDAHGDRHIFCSEEEKDMPPWAELSAQLRWGDLFIIRRGGWHVKLYAGTLRLWGFTEEDSPELAPWLDHPLVIHCGYHPAFGERFQELIDHGPRKFFHCSTTNGGVAVSLLGPPPEAAPHYTRRQEGEAWYFELEDGTLMTVMSLRQVSRWCWVRLGE